MCMDEQTGVLFSDITEINCNSFNTLPCDDQLQSLDLPLLFIKQQYILAFTDLQLSALFSPKALKKFVVYSHWPV